MNAPAPVTCSNRGCDEPLPAGRWTKCAKCLLGRTPAFRRKVAAVALVEALPALMVPAGACGFRIPGSPLGVNRAFMPSARGARTIRHTPEAREWRRIVGTYAARAKPPGWRLDGSFSVEIFSVFISPLADSDGPLKLVLDALQGVLYENDRQVIDTRTRKGEPSATTPRLEVIVRRS